MILLHYIERVKVYDENNLVILQEIYKRIKEKTVCVHHGNVVALSEGDLGLDPWQVQIKDLKISVCCLATLHIALRKKAKTG